MPAFSTRRLMMVAVAAIAFRLLFLAWGWTGWRTVCDDPSYNTLTKIYIYQGYALCAGYGYASPMRDVDLAKLASEGRVTPETAPSLDPAAIWPETLHPPGMALLVAAIHRVLGGRVEVPLQLIGAMLDTIAACLVYWSVSTFFRDNVGFVAGLLYAFYPPLPAAAVLVPSPEGMLSVFIVGCLACILQGTRSTGVGRIAWYVGAGILLGLGSYLRPDYLLMPVAVGVGHWMYTRRFWQSVARMAMVQSVALLLLTPWAYRNHEVCGRWIFTSTSVGMTLITGLAEYHNAWGFGGTDGDRDAEAKAQGLAGSAFGSEGDLYFRRVFWESVKSKPLGYLTTIVKRVPMALFTVQSFGYANPNKNARFGEAMTQGRDKFDVLREQPFYVLTAYWDWLLMGVVGLAALLSSCYMMIREWRRFGLVFLLMSPHLYSIGTHMLTHLEPRFLLPSMFCFLVGLAYVLCGGPGFVPGNARQATCESLRQTPPCSTC